MTPMLGFLVIASLTSTAGAVMTEERAKAALEFIEHVAKAPATEFVTANQDVAVRKSEITDALQWFIANDRGLEALRTGAAMVRFWRAPEALDWQRRILAVPSNATATQRLPFLITASSTAFHVGDQRLAQRWAKEALSLAQAANDNARIATAHFRLSQIALRDRRLREFHRINEAMFQHCAVTNDARCESNARNMRGEAARVERNYDLAADMNRQILEYGKRNASESAIRNATVNLAFIDLGRGRTTDVRERLLEALSLFEAANNRDTMAMIVAAMGMLRELQNDSASGARLLGLAAAEFERLGTIPDPADEDLIAQCTERMKRALGRKRFAREYAEGKTLNFEQTIAEMRR